MEILAEQKAIFYRKFLSPNEVVMSKISIVDVNEHINQWKVIKTHNLK